jgi:pilus assembly protein CpaE
VHLDAIARALDGDGDISIAKVQGGADELKGLRKPGDVVVINGTAIDNGGLDVIEKLGHAHPGTSFIIVTANQSAEFLRSAMRAGVREVLPCPAPAEELRLALTRLKTRPGAATLDGKVFAFMPVKGGSGSTFIATNLGYVLAGQADRKVLLLDLNLQFGDAALFVSEQRPSTDIAEIAREIHRMDASFLSSSLVNVLPNYGVLAAPDDPAHSIDVKPQHIEAILEIARKHYDYILLDLDRYFDAVTLKALDSADVIFPVLQVGLPYIRDGKRLLGVLRSLGYSASKVKLVVNRYQKASEIGLADLERALGMQVFKTIPNNYHASSASANQGVPIVKLDRSNPVSRGLSELAHEVAPAPEVEQKGWISRMLGRK